MSDIIFDNAKSVNRMSENENLHTVTQATITSLLRSRDLLRKRKKPHIESQGLTWGQFEVLSMLNSVERGKQVTPTQLYTTLSITSGGLTKMLSGLESRGLIERVSNQTDGRSQLIRLSDQGRTLVGLILEEMVAKNAAALTSIFTEEELHTFSGLVCKLHKGLSVADK